jgi:Tfp pilus assembly protein PilN
MSLVLVLHLWQKRTIVAEQTTLLQLEKEHRQLSVKVEEIKNLEQELEKLTQRQALLTKVAGNHSHAVLLMKLAQIMNGHTWLTELKVEDKKEDDEKVSEVDIRLKGFSYSNEDLGNFVIQLSADHLFKGVVLDHAKEASSRKPMHGMTLPDSLIQFQIDCQV